MKNFIADRGDRGDRSDRSDRGKIEERGDAMVDIGECYAIVQEAVILGEAIAECRFAPLSDRMSRRQAVQYLVSRGYRTPEATLLSWQQQGILHIRKPPGSANRKLIISFRELQQCVLAHLIQKSL